MTYLVRLAGVFGVLCAVAAQAFGQGHNNAFPIGWWQNWCTDPAIADPASDDFSSATISSPLMGVTVGQAGTWQYGNSDDVNGIECIQKGIPELFTATAAGRIGFMIGGEGSIQTSFDDSMMLTFGMPIAPGNTSGYAAVVTGAVGAEEKFLFEGGFNLFFSGESDRYLLVETTLGTTRTKLVIDIIGDAIRLEWQLTNLAPFPNNIGLWFGEWIAMLTQDGDMSGLTGSPEPFIVVPGLRPTRLETRWIRSGDSAIFPEFVNFNFSQEQPYGMRIENEPSASTTDPETGQSDATEADEFALGIHGETASGIALLGDIDTTDVFPDTMFPTRVEAPGFTQSDIAYRDNPSFIQKFYPEVVAPGATRVIVHYVRSTWGESSYTPPYSAVVDAPRLFNYEPSGTGGLDPNPATVRVWVDNTRGFSSAEREVPLQNVRVTLDLSNSTGFTFVGGGKQQTKVIPRIEARRFASVDFQIQADDTAIGRIPYTVRIVAPPGPNKTLIGQMEVSVTPKVELDLGANLLSMPWEFSDSAWASILQLQQPTEFQAFNWDPIQQGYVIATSAERGKGTWIVLKVPIPDPNELRPLSSNPTVPEDTAEGANLIELQQGWNMIGNPYQYPVPIGQLIGVIRNDPTKTFTWKEMVDGGMVNGGLAFWDEDTDSYRFITDIEARLEPHRGYWVFVNDSGLTLRFPPVFLEGAITRSASRSTRAWTQTDKQWRLQLVARAGEELDDQNYLGIAPSTREARSLSIGEPPMSPTQKVAVSVAPPLGTGTRQAYAFSDKQGRQEWTVLVESKQAGPITLTWPNMGTVPKNVRFRLVDVATGASRDMRRTSGYTFEAQENTTRELKVQVEPGGVSRAVIGNVVVSQPNRGRDRNAPFTISYTLTGDATTTVRILGPGGREVYTATRGRADRAGENTVTWALRDNANRAVAPGTYRVEILAETADGERVRKVVPVNVIR